MDGLLFGFILALFSLAGAIIWDIIKRIQDSKQQDEVVVIAIKAEIENNSRILDRNIEIIEAELKIVDSNQIVVEPLTLLRNGGWDLLRGHLPQALVKQPDSLAQLNEFFVAVEQLNETIRSREAYRVNNGAMSNYQNRVKIYNGIIVQRTILVLRSMVKLNPALHLELKVDKDIEKLLTLG